MVDSVENYLARNIHHLELILEQVLLLVPDSYFYKPDVNQAYFCGFRKDLEEMRRKSFSVAYRQDGYLKNSYLRHLRQYDKELKEVADRNRANLMEVLKQETNEMKLACLYNLITYYRLLKYLRTFNN